MWEWAFGSFSLLLTPSLMLEFADDWLIDSLGSMFFAPNISSLPMFTLMFTLKTVPRSLVPRLVPCYSIALVALFLVAILSELLPPLLNGRVKKLL